MAERISNPTEQRLILKDGRTLGFAEYGDPKGEPMLEFHGCPSSRLEARNYDEAGKKLGARVIGIDRPGFGISTYVKGYRTVDWPAASHRPEFRTRKSDQAARPGKSWNSHRAQTDQQQRHQDRRRRWSRTRQRARRCRRPSATSARLAALARFNPSA